MTTKTKNVLVTGASGHVGSNLVRALLSKGYQVRALIHDSYYPGLRGLPVELVQGDVCDRASLENACQGMDGVFHLAAIISICGDPTGIVHKVNVQGVENVVGACLSQRIRRLVHFCSVHAFNQNPLYLPIDETRERALGAHHYAYDRSKALGEIAVKKGIAQGLDAVIVHPSGIVGPFDFRPSRMGQVLLDLFNRKLVGTVAGGFDWVDSRDVALGAIGAFEKGESGENYILSGHWASIREVAHLAADFTGVRAPILHTPMGVARLVAPFAEVWARLTKSEPLFTRESLGALRANKVFLHEKAQRTWGYEPRPLEETIRDTYLWMAAQQVIALPSQSQGAQSQSFREEWAHG